MFKFDFETLHPNHKYAFLDGLLSGMLVSYIAYRLHQDKLEEQKLDRWMEESRKAKFEKHFSN